MEQGHGAGSHWALLTCYPGTGSESVRVSEEQPLRRFSDTSAWNLNPCRDKYKGSEQEAPLLKVRADDLDHVLRGFLCGFGILRHVVEDVVFHEFPHQAVGGATGGSETAKNLGALLVAIQSLKYGLELPDDFFGSIDHIQFFSRSMRHFG
jgi:hypothetical protein